MFAYSYQYDLNNNVHTVTDQLTQLATQCEYDPDNRIIHETLANGLSLSYTYDGLNRPLKVILPDQTHVEYTYDACQLKTVSRPSYEHHYTSYDLSGALLEEHSPIGEIAYTWDLLNRPRSIQSSYFTETIPEEGYDAVGNLLNKIRKDPDRITHCRYSYDALYQLKSETITGFDAHEYTYDSLYNRRLRDNKEHTINHLNQLLSVEETSYTYDKRGNLIAETTPTSHTEYHYDALGRLTSLSRNGINYTYQYDAFNRRLQKTSDQTTERYIYAGQNEIGQVNEQGKITQLRILGSGKEAEIGSAIALELDDQIYIPLYDHCGHVSLLVDLATKQFAEAYVYSAFGEEQRYGPGTTNPWHFSSKRYDPESGWIYFGRRYYDPSTGRWTTPDPIGFTDGPNLYAYVKNSPLTHFDAYGLISGGFGGSLYDMNRTQRSQNRTARGNQREVSCTGTSSCKGGFFNSIHAACNRACRDFAANAYYDARGSLSVGAGSIDQILYDIDETERSRECCLNAIKQQTEQTFQVNSNSKTYQWTHRVMGWGLFIGSIFIPIAGQERAVANFTTKALPRPNDEKS